MWRNTKIRFRVLFNFCVYQYQQLMLPLPGEQIVVRGVSFRRTSKKKTFSYGFMERVVRNVQNVIIHRCFHAIGQVSQFPIGISKNNIYINVKIKCCQQAWFLRISCFAHFIFTSYVIFYFVVSIICCSWRELKWKHYEFVKTHINVKIKCVLIRICKQKYTNI